jgi:hypothetical protein
MAVAAAAAVFFSSLRRESESQAWRIRRIQQQRRLAKAAGCTSSYY